jgi:SAM-dependent methyltransferase
MAICVQYGCGFQAPTGWLNFDASPTLRFERLPLIGQIYTKNSTRFPPAVQYGNIVKGLPLSPNSVDKLYASHVLEHLTYEEALLALANSHTLLKPGGVFRLIVPDLHARASRYLTSSNKADAANKFQDSTLLGHRTRARGFFAAIIAAYGNSHHLWMWDEPSLTDALRRTGFNNIRRYSFGDRYDSDFCRVEQYDRFVSGDIVELAIECSKP